MRTLACVMLLGAPQSAQEPPTDLLPVMQRCAEHVDSLHKAIEARDRTAIAAAAIAIATAAQALRDPTADADHADNRAVATIAAAAGDLQQPLGDGIASDAHDFARLRAGCTSCHVRRRDRNDERGLFPDRANVVHGTVRLEERDGTLRPDASGVVVFLEAPTTTASPLPRAPAISQRGRRFDPAVVVVTAGSRVVFPNDDLVFHNVFSRSRGNAFDLGTYGKGTARERTFPAPGLVKVHCNIHPEMSAHVLVLATPFATVTAPDGLWCLPDVPDGTYTLRIWQPLADEQRHVLTVAGRRATAVPLVVRESKPRLPHQNKHGLPYPEKY